MVGLKYQRPTTPIMSKIKIGIMRLKLKKLIPKIPLLYKGKKLVNVIPETPFITLITFWAIANNAANSKPNK